MTPKEPGLRVGLSGSSAWVSPLHTHTSPLLTSIPHTIESDHPVGLYHFLTGHSPSLSFLPLYQQVSFLLQELGEEGSDWGGRDVAKPLQPGLSGLASLDPQPWTSQPKEDGQVLITELLGDSTLGRRA